MTERRRRQDRERQQRHREKVRQEQAAQFEMLRRQAVAANERRYPELFRQIRQPEFLRWFERAAGFTWREDWETDVHRMEAMIEFAAEMSSS